MAMLKGSVLIYRDVYPRIDKIWLVYLLIISIPFCNYSFFNIGDRGLLRPDWFFAFLIIIVFYLRLCIRTERLQINATGKWILLLNGIALISLFRPLFYGSSVQLIDFFTKYLQLLLVSLMYFALSSLKVRQDEINTILKVWILTAFFISLYAIYQVFARNLDLSFAYLTITNPTFGEVTAGGTYGTYTRPSAFFMEPSFLGSYLVAPLLLMVVLLLNPRQKVLLFRKHIYWIILICIALALLLSFSLAALATIGLISFFMMFRKEMLKKSVKLLAILFIVASVVFIVLPSLGIYFGSTFGRIRNLSFLVSGDTSLLYGSSFGVRLAKAITTFNVGLAHSILGVGLNNVSYYSPGYGPEWYTWVASLEYNHNAWITTFAEMGILGLFALIFLWYSAVREVKHSIKRFAGDSKWVIVFTAFYFILWSDIINSNFTHEIMHPQRWFNLAIVGLLLNKFNNRVTKS